MVTIFNKCDLVKDQYILRKMVADRPDSVYISALEKEGISHLMALLSKTLQSLLVRMSLEIPYNRSDLVSLCYESGKVLKAEYTTEAILVEAEVSREIAGRLQKYLRG
jgi:GTP-binding protein HflX